MMFRLALMMHPALHNPLFQAHRYAVAICWCVARSLDEAKSQAMSKLRDGGWNVVKLISEEDIPPRNESERRARQRALRQGYFARIELGRRIHLDSMHHVSDEPLEVPLTGMFVDLCLEIKRRRSAFVLAVDDEYARGDLGGQPLVPLFGSVSLAEKWKALLGVEASRPDEISLEDVCALLRDVDAEDEDIGVGFDQFMVTFHPMSILDLIAEGDLEIGKVDRLQRLEDDDID